MLTPVNNNLYFNRRHNKIIKDFKQKNIKNDKFIFLILSLRFLLKNILIIKNSELQDFKYFSLNIIRKQLLWYIQKLNFRCKNNVCIITGRSRSVYKYGRLTRMQLKRLANLGYISGVVASSW